MVDDDGVDLCICNSMHDLQRLRIKSYFWRSIPRHTSLGVHDEQLTPEEYFAHLTVEVSANWDFMVESRSRPRPSQLHPNATGDTADEVIGTRSAETIEVGDVSHAETIEAADGSQLNLQQSHWRKLDVAYAPLLHLRDISLDPLDIIHRLAAANALDGRSGDKFSNVQQFIRARHHEYQALKQPRAIAYDTASHGHMTKTFSSQDELQAITRQRDVSLKRNEIEKGQRAATDADHRMLAAHEPYEDDPGDAMRVDVSQLCIS